MVDDDTNGNSQFAQEAAAPSEAPKPSWIEAVPPTEEEEAVAEADAEAVEAPKPKKRKTKVVKKAKAPTAKLKKKAKLPPAGLDDYGFRKGSIRSKAAVMYASAKGATLAEVRAKLGGTQYNMMTELKKRGFKITTKVVDGVGNRPASRYFLQQKKR